ncbi:restriction endonuclease subunit S [Streptomyces sp. NBC_00989]|uniref:restriction endonuclease subunit S n=1 Tax=Streptomyces sp. NBC_00989 TaxID=2903705 RepID=UPI00386F5FE4|nr:restriction endonuclease subunit S [Streptomyces sp. NBC_00989]
MRNLSQEALRRMPVALPPFTEQRRIVDALEEQLSRLDAAMGSVSKMRARCNSLASTLSDRAVLGQLDSATPSVCNVSLEQIRSATRRLGGKRWKSTDAIQLPGMVIPEGWMLASLGDLAWGYGYGTSTKCEYGGVGDPVLRIPNIQDGEIDTGDVKRALDGALDLSGYHVRRGEILFVRTNGSPALIGRVGVVERDMDYAFASYLIRFKLNSEFVDPRWVAMVTQSRTWRRHIQRVAASSAGQYNLNSKLLAELPIPLPVLSVQRQLLEQVSSELSWVRRLSSVSDTVLQRSRGLRMRLLQKAFQGGLVAQDPSDEHASVSLTRITATRAAPPKSKGPRKAAARGSSKALAPRAAALIAPAPTPAPANAVQQEFDL